MSAVPLHTPSPPPPAPGPPRLRLVGSVPRWRRLAFAMLLSSIGTVAVFATVALNALAAGDAVAALQAEKAVEAAESRYTELVARVATLEDPARIERVAVEEIGMIPARGVRFLVLDRPLPEEHATTPVEVAGGTRVWPQAPAGPPRPQAPGGLADPLKPLLSVQR